MYNGIFNLFVLAGARDWMTGKIPLPEEYDDHHIVPVSWGTANLEAGRVHTILNRTPLTANTNRAVIADKLPNRYLQELIARSGEPLVCEILETHFISPAALAILLRDPFTPDDFEAFISERQKTLEAAIENLLVKERLTLAPHLRELDAKIEKVELALREMIVHALADDPTRLPSHVYAKAKERIQAAMTKNAAMDAEQYRVLQGTLEFCDLRELQDTILAKALWPCFEPRFVHKDVLSMKVWPSSPSCEMAFGIAAQWTMSRRWKAERQSCGSNRSSRRRSSWQLWFERRFFVFRPRPVAPAACRLARSALFASASSSGGAPISFADGRRHAQLPQAASQLSGVARVAQHASAHGKARGEAPTGLPERRLAP